MEKMLSELYKFLKSEAPQAEEDEESKLLYGKLEDMGLKLMEKI